MWKEIQRVLADQSIDIIIHQGRFECERNMRMHDALLQKKFQQNHRSRTISPQLSYPDDRVCGPCCCLIAVLREESKFIEQIERSGNLPV